jgi:hypothetical protein
VDRTAIGRLDFSAGKSLSNVSRSISSIELQSTVDCISQESRTMGDLMIGHGVLILDSDFNARRPDVVLRCTKGSFILL